MAAIEPGQKAPAFSLPDQDGVVHRLKDYADRPVILYFYPKDDTPGCTTEACEFRDLRPRFDVAGARVLGVSPDEISSHERFRARYDLNFTLLSDPGHTAAEAYGVWVEKSRSGRTYMGVERSTFVIGPDGLLEQAMYGVKAPGHATSVLETIGQA
jgi:peroxiredoxin Q/BCP